MALAFGPRRGIYLEVGEAGSNGNTDADLDIGPLGTFDLIYRSLCAALYNYAPTSGHPGGSISSGRIVCGCSKMAGTQPSFSRRARCR